MIKLKAIFSAAVLMFSASAFAAFTGPYELPGGWSEGVNAGTATLWDISGAPDTAVLRTYVPWNASANAMSTTAAADGTVSFDWAYALTAGGDPANFPTSYQVNGGAVQLLSSNIGGVNQSGSVSVGVSAGDTIVIMNGLTNNPGGQVLALTISNFSGPEVLSVAAAPNPVPTLSELGIIFLSSMMAMFGIWQLRRGNPELR